MLKMGGCFDAERKRNVRVGTFHFSVYSVNYLTFFYNNLEV